MCSYSRDFEEDRRLMLPWKRNMEIRSIWNMTWSVHHHVLSLEYLYFLTGPQTTDIVSWCCTSQLNVFLSNCSTVPPQVAAVLSENKQARPSHWLWRTLCCNKFSYFCSVHCNSCCNGEVVPSVGCGPGVFLWTGSHASNSWECLVYSFQGIKQKC